MRIFSKIIILFYLAIILFVVGVVIAFSLRVLTLDEVSYFLDLAYNDPQVRIWTGSVSGVLLLVSLLLAQVVLVTRKRERTVAFDNPHGRVSISLDALEDMIKRLVLKTFEVKEVRPSIIATKRGIEVTCRMILKVEASIPEMTQHLQEIIKGRVQDVLGVEENIFVLIHITKISADGSKSKEVRGEPAEKTDFSVPFRGYSK